jgi:predicted XRE-type DNA-binding protein
MGRANVTESSGNVFADLGAKDPDTALAKAELAAEITRIIRGRRLSQAQAAALLGTDQPKVSKLMRGKLEGFTAERLMRYLTCLGRDVNITIKRRRRASERGRLAVVTQD